MIIRSNNNIINTGSILHENIFKTNISFEWIYKIDKLYAIMFYGEILPSSPNERIINDHFYYYLAANITRNDISYKNEIIPYDTPIKSNNNKETNYYVEIYEYSDYIEPTISIINNQKLNLIDELTIKIVNDSFEIYKKFEKLKITSEQLKNYLIKNENINLAKKYFDNDVVEYTKNKQNLIAEDKTKGTQKYCSCLIENILNKSKDCLKDKIWNSNSCSDPSFNCDSNISSIKDKCICASLYDFEKLSDDDINKIAIYFNVDIYGRDRNYDRQKSISVLRNEFNNRFNLNETVLNEAIETKRVSPKSPPRKIMTKKPQNKKSFKLLSELPDVDEIDEDELDNDLNYDLPDLDEIEIKEAPSRKSVKSPRRESVKSPRRESVKSPRRESVKSPRRESVTSSAVKSVKSPRMESVKSPRRESVTSSAMKSVTSSAMKSVKSPRRESVTSSAVKSIKSPRRESVTSSAMKSIKTPRRESVKSPQRESVTSSAMKSIKTPRRESVKSPRRESVTSPVEKSIAPPTKKSVKPAVKPPIKKSVKKSVKPAVKPADKKSPTKKSVKSPRRKSVVIAN